MSVFPKRPQSPKKSTRYIPPCFSSGCAGSFPCYCYDSELHVRTTRVASRDLEAERFLACCICLELLACRRVMQVPRAHDIPFLSKASACSEQCRPPACVFAGSCVGQIDPKNPAFCHSVEGVFSACHC